jgi:hypothetical protein
MKPMLSDLLMQTLTEERLRTAREQRARRAARRAGPFRRWHGRSPLRSEDRQPDDAAADWR